MIARVAVVVAFGCSSSAPSRVGESPSPPPSASPAVAVEDAAPASIASDPQTNAGSAVPVRLTSKDLGLDSKAAPWLDGPWYESWAEIGLSFLRVKICVPKSIGRKEQDHASTVFESGAFEGDCEKAPNVMLATQRATAIPTKEEVSEGVVSGSRVHRIVHSANEAVVVSDFEWFRREAPHLAKTTQWLVTVTRVAKVGREIIWCTAKCGTLKESAVQAIGRGLEPVCTSLIESTNQRAVWEPDGACPRIGR
jgi:hypothetical protein